MEDGARKMSYTYTAYITVISAWCNYLLDAVRDEGGRCLRSGSGLDLFCRGLCSRLRALDEKLVVRRLSLSDSG